MTHLRDIAALLETWAPPQVAQDYDNVGLQVGDFDQEIRRVLVALDLTPGVLDEAESIGADLIVTHHPLLFRPIRHLRPGEWVPSLVLRTARSGIALYAAHTNLDAAPGGVSFALAHRLGLTELEFLEPMPAPDGEAGRFGMGAVGLLPSPEPLTAFLRRTADRLETPALRFTGDPARSVEKVAVCGGSGSSLIEAALRAGADAFVTADVTYHRFFEALSDDGSHRMALVDAGHYETEFVAEQLLVDRIAERFPDLAVHRTTVRTSPMAVYTRP